MTAKNRDPFGILAAERAIAVARKRLADLEARAVEGRATDDVSPRVYAEMADARVVHTLAERALAKAREAELAHAREVAARRPIVVEDASHRPDVALPPPESTNGHHAVEREADE